MFLWRATPRRIIIVLRTPSWRRVAVRVSRTSMHCRSGLAQSPQGQSQSLPVSVFPGTKRCLCVSFTSFGACSLGSVEPLLTLLCSQPPLARGSGCSPAINWSSADDDRAVTDGTGRNRPVIQPSRASFGQEIKPAPLNPIIITLPTYSPSSGSLPPYGVMVRMQALLRRAVQRTVLAMLEATTRNGRRDNLHLVRLLWLPRV